MPPGGIASTVSDIANRVLARADRTVSSSSVTGTGQESYRDYYTVNHVVPHGREPARDLAIYRNPNRPIR
jgi:hypothetical protein